MPDLISADVILTEVDYGIPCAEGPQKTAPMGSYTCRWDSGMSQADTANTQQRRFCTQKLLKGDL